MTAIVDYDTGNLRSVADALHRAGAEFTLTADPALLRGAEAVNKSWPAFWDTLRGLGAKIDTE